MRSQFYRMLDDVEVPDRWWLRAPTDDDGKAIDPEIFGDGKPLIFRAPLKIPLRYEGVPLDFTFGAFEMPVATKRTATLLRNVTKNDFQSFPAIVERHQGDFEVINFLKVIHCLDEKQSDILYWTEADGRPDKIGEYRQVANMRIDPSRVQHAEIFRIGGWEIALIASQAVKDEFEQEGISGVRFVPVC